MNVSFKTGTSAWRQLGGLKRFAMIDGMGMGACLEKNIFLDCKRVKTMKENLFSQREKAFLAALKYHVERDWKGQQSKLALKGGLSPAYLSEMIAGRKICKSVKREALVLAAAPEMTYEEFLKFGETAKNLPPARPNMNQSKQQDDTQTDLKRQISLYEELLKMKDDKISDLEKKLAALGGKS